MFNEWKDEFESAACLALVEAARSFDPSQEHPVLDLREVPNPGPPGERGPGVGPPGLGRRPGGRPGPRHPHALTTRSTARCSSQSQPPHVGSEFDDIDAVEHLLRKLPKKHATVCRMQYLYGKTQSEIAAMLGCSQAEITRLHMKALELLSDPYDADGQVNRTTWRRRRTGRKPEPGQVDGSDPVVADRPPIIP